jgi:hypothetical protein
MSRRCHHGSPRHVRPTHVVRRPAATSHAVEAAPVERIEAIAADPEPAEVETPRAEPADEPVASRAEASAPAPRQAPRRASRTWAPSNGAARPASPARTPWRAPAPTPPIERAVPAQADGEAESRPEVPGEAERVATAAQLRRFIKSRAYVPMHELRRRFAINGHEDDVTALDLDRNRVYVGLPEREGRLLGELLRGGDIGYELSLDPVSPVVVGVYPMRPVTRG